MSARTGKQYLDNLKSRPREVWVKGERVGDVTEHPAFRRPVRHIAHLYDMQHDPAHRDTLTCESPRTGARVGTAFMPARTLADLEKRRGASRLWAEATLGMMGRSPDFMNLVLLSFAEGREVFDRRGRQFGDNLVRYYEYMRENDLFMTHAIMQPQVDRARAAAEQAEDFLYLGLVRETDKGLVVRGARMLATLGPLADEVLIYNYPGLKPQDTKHALVFAIPVDTPGLRQICRPPYDDGARSAYDHPLAVNFEECDSLLVFDDVLVPWERVFMYNDPANANAVFPDTNLRNYTAHQTSVRGLVKLELAVGVTIAMARSVKTDGFLHVQEMMGECLNYIEVVKSCILRSEIEHETTAAGTIRPRYEPLMAIRTLLPRWYPRIIEVMQIIGAGGLLALPSSHDFASPIGDVVARYYQGAEGMPAEERVKLCRLAWDLCGDAFGMRQLQYERYYAGDPYRQTAINYLTYDLSGCEATVRRALDLAGRPMDG
jgi:anthranilate 3-monooxygenase (FAD)/4-hydroxyphenylacetate 3-monooxygenase